jgi:hypothetical protein
MEYKALIIKNLEDKCVLFFETEDGKISDGIPITDSQGIYNNISHNQIVFSKVEFCDGTIPMRFEHFSDIDDIFFRIKDLCSISLFDNDKKEVVALESFLAKPNELSEEFFKQPIFNNA